MKKFKVPAIPNTTNKGIRFPNTLIEEIESKLVGTDYSFSKFVIEAAQKAIQDLEEQDLKEKRIEK